MLVEVTYTGNMTRNIITGYSENPIVYIPGNCQAGQYALTAAGPCSNTTAANRDGAANPDAAESDVGPLFRRRAHPGVPMAPAGTTTASSSR